MTQTAPSLRVGLLGRGIGASASPAIHSSEAAELGIALSYDLFDFDAVGLPDEMLAAQLAELVESGFAGVNVTHPFKQAVMPLLDEIDATAETLGAVNCIAFRGGKTMGSNTDWTGFGFLMQQELPAAATSAVAQIGAGGAGSATAFALLDRGVQELRIFDNTADQANDLVSRLAAAFPSARVRTCESAAEAIKQADGVVQATPIGMADHLGVPFDPDLLDRRQWLAEIIYFPPETELLCAARNMGLATAGGAAMVVGQAAEAFKQFTGVEPDRARMLARFSAASANGLRRGAA